jgi:hypothetical protein
VKDIKHTDVLALSGETCEFFIESFRVLSGELVDTANAQQIEVAQHGGPYGNQVL